MPRRDVGPHQGEGDSSAQAGPVARGGRGGRRDDDRAVPVDEQVGAMSGVMPLGRLRRIPVSRRRGAPGSQVAGDPVVPLALSDFHDLRRLGLFGDDGRNPPPSWWAR